MHKRACPPKRFAQAGCGSSVERSVDYQVQGDYHVFMSDTHFKGVIGELEFTSHLIKKGYTVLTPVNPNSCYDLVIEKEGTFTKLQVKYCTPRNGTLCVELDRKQRTTKSYKERGVDAMGAYDSVHEKFYLIPMDKIKTKKEIWLRVEQSKSAQTKNVHFAEEFEI